MKSSNKWSFRKWATGNRNMVAHGEFETTASRPKKDLGSESLNILRIGSVPMRWRNALSKGKPRDRHRLPGVH